MEGTVRKRAELLSARVDGGVVVYDSVAGVAHHLISPVADVWDACDQGLTSDEVINRCGVPAEDARDALAWLGDAQLLQLSGPALSRRKLLVGAAVVSGTAAASTILLPAAMAAASTSPVKPPGCPHLSAWCYAVWATTPCYWTRCDESAPTPGSSCIDYSGNRCNGIYKGSCSTRSGAIGCDSDPGVHLEDTGSTLCFTPGGTPSSTWTLGAFFNPSASCTASKGIALLSCGQTATVDLCIRLVSNKPCWVITTAQGGKVSKTCSAPLGKGGLELLSANGSGSSTWHFVCLSWNGKAFTVTVDGVTDGSLVPNNVRVTDGGDNKTQCFGGNVATGLSYTGGLDEAICWQEATPASLLGMLYASSLSGAV